MMNNHYRASCLAVAPSEVSGTETETEVQGGPHEYFTYILQSEIAPRIYVGFTAQEHPSLRLEKHNSGSTIYTNRYKPWKLISYISVPTESQARTLEVYYKTGAGRAFLSKYILTFNPNEPTNED